MWLRVSVCFFVICWFLTHSYCSFSLGMQWTVAPIIMVILWVFAAPAMYVSAIVLNKGLEAVWGCLCVAYIVLGLILLGMFAVFDWKTYSAEVQERERIAMEKHASADSDVGINETSPLVA